MIRGRYRPGEPICWKDGEGVWQHGTVREVTNGSVTVAVDDQRLERIDAASGRTHPQTTPFKNTAHPSNPRAWVFLHALTEAVDAADISWDHVGLLWTDGSPTIVFAPSVPESKLTAVRIAVERSTPEDLVASQRQCETMQFRVTDAAGR